MYIYVCVCVCDYVYLKLTWELFVSVTSTIMDGNSSKIPYVMFLVLNFPEVLLKTRVTTLIGHFPFHIEHNDVIIVKTSLYNLCGTFFCEIAQEI